MMFCAKLFATFSLWNSGKKCIVVSFPHSVPAMTGTRCLLQIVWPTNAAGCEYFRFFSFGSQYSQKQPLPPDVFALVPECFAFGFPYIVRKCKTRVDDDEHKKVVCIVSSAGNCYAYGREYNMVFDRNASWILYLTTHHHPQ